MTTVWYQIIETYLSKSSHKENLKLHEIVESFVKAKKSIVKMRLTKEYKEKLKDRA